MNGSSADSADLAPMFAITAAVAIYASEEVAEDEKATPSPEEIEDLSPEEVEDLLRGKGWKGEPTKNGQGTRYPNPNINGEQIRVHPNGTPNTSRPDLHEDPYAIISRGGVKTRVPLRK